VCDGITRREALRVGSLSMFGGVTLEHLLRAQGRADERGRAKAKSVVLINLFGGPPHQDMFDLKPNAPESVRGEMKAASTVVPGLSICDLMPKIGKLMDRATLIRTYSHRYNSHNPYNVLTGFDGGNDRENYFAKATDHPSMGSICQYMDMGPKDAPRYVILPAFPGYSQALRRAGPYGGYLGSRYDPLFTVCDPKYKAKSKDDYDPVTPEGAPRPPSMDELPGLTADRLDKRRSLLEQFDAGLRAVETRGGLARLNEFKRQAFAILSSSKTRSAFELNSEDEAQVDKYGRNLWGSSCLIARRLVEVGSTFVSVNWEAKNGNHWDLHGNNFGMLRHHLPILDSMVSALVTDLEARGLLDQTLVVVMGEMGRTPKINAKAGRDHWPQCGFSLMFGGGVTKGNVIGATDKQAAYPTDRPVTAGDMVATIYELLGVDWRMTVTDLSGRPNRISHGGSPVFEAIA
jgi:hypothetical protein